MIVGFLFHALFVYLFITITNFKKSNINLVHRDRSEVAYTRLCRAVTQKDSPDSTHQLLQNNRQQTPLNSLCLNCCLDHAPGQTNGDSLDLCYKERRILIAAICQQLSNKHTLACTHMAATKGALQNQLLYNCTLFTDEEMAQT